MNSFGKRNLMQPMGRPQACTQGALIFFPFKFWGWGRDRFFLHVSLIPNVFPLSSQWVLIWFPIYSPSSQCVPQHVLHSTYPICFAKISPPFRYIGGPKGRNSELQNKTFILGSFHGFILKKYFEGDFRQGSKLHGAMNSSNLIG